MGTTSACHSTMEQRAGVATFKGNPLTLIGPQLKPGDSAPDFEVLGQDLTPVKRSNFAGRTLLISAVPSLDTPVCDAQTRRFNEEAAKLPNVHILAISMDLPFAQKRWCGASGAGHIQVVSDHKNAAFGKAYGVLIKELRLLSRSIFIIDGAGVIRYVEYVPEVTSHPNYDAALTAARQIAKS